MGRSEDPGERQGAEVIDEIRPADPVVLPIGADAEAARKVAARAVAEGRPVFIHKNRFDVFTGNAATGAFLDGLEESLGSRPAFFVVGVARDVCVTQAVDGLQERGYDVTALSDATWGLGLEAEAVTLGRWREGGAVTTLPELVAREP